MLHDMSLEIIFQDLRDIGWEDKHHEYSAKIIHLDQTKCKAK